MATLINLLKNYLQLPDHRNLPDAVKRVLLKEYLQAYLLEFIYSHPEYRKLRFYGGSCLRVVYRLNRMSEDIDLDNHFHVNLDRFNSHLEAYCEGHLLLKGTSIYFQTGELGIGRWTVKLPVLYELGLSSYRDEKLHVKIEISSHFQIAEEKRTPIIIHGRSFVIRHFTLPSLMAGKIIACLERNFRKGDTDTNIKGRDWYDLLWFMQQQILPDEKKLAQNGAQPYRQKDAFVMLQDKVTKIRPIDLSRDLEQFFTHKAFIDAWIESFHENFERFLNFYTVPAR